MAAFEYTPLNWKTRSIRLLKFETPPPGSDVICCSLETYELDSCPRFAALSYTWGQPDSCKDQEIYLDWWTFPVRKNLHAALCSMRHFEDEDQLWLKTSTALTDFTSHQTDLPELMATLKGYTRTKKRWQAVVHKMLKSNCVMIRDRAHGYNNDQRLEAFWEIFKTMMGYDEATEARVYDHTTIADWQQRYYWVDAICINQDDDKERGHHVDFMGDIYRRADRVIAWLGPATAESNRVIGAMACGTWPYDEKDGTNLEAHLESIAGRSYWRRLWTAQE